VLRLRLGHRLERRSPPSGSRARRSTRALAIKNTEIVEELSLPPVKIHCSVLAEDAIRAAIEDYKTKNGDRPPTPRSLSPLRQRTHR
jgi:hypothetical protein